MAGTGWTSGKDRRGRGRAPSAQPWVGPAVAAGIAFARHRGRNGPKRRLAKAGRLFGLTGPLGPFSPVWRSGAFKYVVAIALTRATARGAARRFGRGADRQRRPTWWLNLWDRRPDRPDRQDRPVPGRALAPAPDREYEREYEREWEEEGMMPRFGRGFPGSERPHGRRFDRGDVKYVLLDLLREGPRHGYDMIKELEKRSGGFYSPSPGSVYPTLQMLEDQGFVTSSTVDGKRTYRLTDAGYAFIDERSARTDDARGRSWTEGDAFQKEMRSVGREAGELARSLRDAVRSYTPDARQVNEIRDVIGETRKRIEAILAERRETPVDDHDKPTVV